MLGSSDPIGELFLLSPQHLQLPVVLIDLPLDAFRFGTDLVVLLPGLKHQGRHLLELVGQSLFSQ